ncbi:hypothetical protein [Streptomyces sp. CB00455]|uniref:hypothetical protein n=1 Tax=Streptomyces sp. CB00455 TaxID=1703927 RepID=UPI000938BB24|nr:hypothetical protein [Streptomyces sp. CB00455]
MDGIAQHAGVAKGLNSSHVTSKRGYRAATVEDSVALGRRARRPRRRGSRAPATQRVRRTIDGYLHYAEHHQGAADPTGRPGRSELGPCPYAGCARP